MIFFNEREYGCPMEMVLDVIGGKWKSLILWHLNLKTVMRFGELERTLPRMSRKMLTQQIRELERDGLVFRNVYHQVPPKVEYSLTETGQSLMPVLKALNEWGHVYMDEKGQRATPEA